MSTALPLASFVTDFWNDQLVEHDRQGVFLVLVGFVGSFAFIRMSTRMIRAEVSWWPGNIESESGLHVHHLVFGIELLSANERLTLDDGKFGFVDPRSGEEKTLKVA